MADIFLSYARANERQAKLIAEALRDSGYSVWFDESLPTHRAYADVIEEQLDAAKAVVVLWSTEAARSQWVRSEANRARETGRLVQIRLAETRLPMPFDQIQCADLTGWRGDVNMPAWQSVLASVGELATEPRSEERENQPARSRRLIHRRHVVGGGAAIVLTSVGFIGWRSLEGPAMSPQSQLLLDRGLAALQDNDALDPQGPGSTLQAIALLTDATEAAPESAVAWGGLAMAFAVRKRVAPLAERAGLTMRSRSAAEKAMQLDPNEIRAVGALRLIEPVYRNWLAAEQADRAALRRHPDFPILIFILSDLLGNVGRWQEAASLSRRFDRRKFLIPGADRKVVINLWAAGDLQGADQALRATVERWPQHPQIWRMRLAYLTFGGRPGEALELLREDAERPADVSQDFVEALRATGEGLAGRRPASAAIGLQLDYLKRTPAAALQVAQACAALGDPGSALEICEGYFFGEGRWARVAPPGGDSDRVTLPLFQPPMQAVWRERRFDALLERIGLNAYWRQTKTVPEFRNGS